MSADISGIWVDGTSVAGDWLRLLSTAPFLAGASPLSVKGGIRYTPGDPAAVTRGPGAWQVTVNPFVAAVPCSIGSKTGAYLLALRAPEPLTVAAPHPTQDRVDLVVVRVIDPAGGAAPFRLEILAGDPSSGFARPPAVPDNCMALASIPILAAATAPGTIADLRAWLDTPTPPRASALVEAVAVAAVSTNSLTWQLLGAPTVAFTAPPSGRVTVVVSARMRVASSGWIAASARITGPAQFRRDPQTADELRSHVISDDTGGQQSGLEFAVAGLVPGESYTALFLLRTNSSATTGSASDRRLLVRPVV